MNHSATGKEMPQSDLLSNHLSEKDRRILELNKERHSLKGISKLLLQRYGIELGVSSVHRHLTELRQDPDNDVQVNYEASAKKAKTDKRWYKIIGRLSTAIDEYTKAHGLKPSSRTMYYQLIDEKFLSGSQSDQNQFSKSTVQARLGWVDSDGELLFPKLDIDCFSDDDSRKVAGDYLSYDPTEPTEPGPIPDPQEYINDMIGRLKYSVIRYDGKGLPGENGRIGGRWYNQPEYVEVWEEKNDLLPAFLSMLRDKSIKIRANKGYPSLIFLYKCSLELKEMIDMYAFDPESITILYCGDLDPSGEDIPRYIKARLKALGIEGINFDIVAVTPQQIQKYNLPLLDISQKKDKEAPNPNMKEFIRRYGNRATHLNAFFTKKRLKTFEQIIRNAVDAHWDEDIYDEMVEEYDIEADKPEEMDEEELLDKRCMMCKTITETFKPGWPKDVSYPEYEYLDDGTDEDEEE